MTKIQIERPSGAQASICELTDALSARLKSGSASLCPVEYSAAFVGACAAQSCGKCTPCRIGLSQLSDLLNQVLDGKATGETLSTIKRVAQAAYLSADCAIGYEAGAAVLRALNSFKEDFAYHVEHHSCSIKRTTPVPCVGGCPAHVDIPGYIALVAAGQYQDAVKLIRKDNPFVAACGLICEHPCELRCRRTMVDDAINIRALKRFAVENSHYDYTPFHYEQTGKTVAIIGGGPAGLTAAYYLALMGHKPTVFEQRKALGGMMRYGIPAYRLPREILQEEIDFLCKQGIEVRLNTSIPSDVTFEQLRNDFDAIYVAIGAHSAGGLRIPNENAEGVLSAVQMLRAIGDGHAPDFTGKRVVVVGGGNVAMDVARSSVRCGAEQVTIAYRRGKAQMTAQLEEIDGAIAEGCELLEMHAPTEVLVDGDKVCGLRVQPQIPGPIEGGRPKPIAADVEPVDISCDYVLVAAGQTINSAPFEEAGMATNRGKLVGDEWAQVADLDGVFVGGDCESGPATVIRAVAAGKAAARNIDDYLGFNHIIEAEVEPPIAQPSDKPACGRAQTSERAVAERADDFDLMENGYTCQQAMQEASRCLRCDYFGMGSFRGGRSQQW